MTARRLVLPGILIGALVLRSIGLQYGLPAVYNPDEVAIMSRALGFARGTLNPHNFLYPTLFFYVLFTWVGIYLAFVWVTGRVTSLAALQQLYFTNPTGIYTAGRFLGVVAGTATVWLLYRLGLRVAGRRAALAAAIFLAVSPLHVRDSHYVKHDVPAALTIVAAYLAMTRIWPASAGESDGLADNAGGRPLALRDTLLAGAAAGVAFSTHYYSIFLAVPLSWVILQRTRAGGGGEVMRHLGAAALASAIGFFALSPFLLVEPLTALRDIAANRAIVVDRAVASGAFGPAARYADMLWRDSVGMPVALLAVAGALWMLVVDRRRAILLLAFPLPFLVFIANTAPASRYLNPVLPFVALFAGWALARASQRVPAPPALFWAIVLLAALPGAASSIQADRFFRQDDTRTLARRYIETEIAADTGILIQPYSVPLAISRQALKEALDHHLGDSRTASTRFQLQLAQEPYPSPAYRLLFLGSGGLDVDKLYLSMAEVAAPDGLARLKGLGVAFVVFKRYNRPDPDSLPFLTALAHEGRRVAVFSPYRPGLSEAEQARIEPFLHNTDTRIDHGLERPGPPLEIWQVDGAGR